MTRFCPTLRPAKFLHLGHAAMLLITRRWAYVNGVEFFHLLSFMRDQMNDLDDAMTIKHSSRGAFDSYTMFAAQLNEPVLRQIMLLRQWVPAPTISTLLSPKGTFDYKWEATRWCDQVMGTTHIWRGEGIEDVYEVTDAKTELHYLPMLTHPDIGVISNDVASGRFRLDHQLRYFNSQWHLLRALVRFVMETYEWHDDEGVGVSSAIFRQGLWDECHNLTANYSDRHNRQVSHEWLMGETNV